MDLLKPHERAPRNLAGEQRRGLARTRQVCRDVAQAASRGRNCLVLTGRTSHVGVLVEGLRSQGLEPLALYGSLKPSERLAVLDRLSAAPDGGPPLLVVATDRYIGEGFDCPRLDTLFLVFPVSSESPMTQYVGRILRDNPGKLGVEVHDYGPPLAGAVHACVPAGQVRQRHGGLLPEHNAVPAVGYSGTTGAVCEAPPLLGDMWRLLVNQVAVPLRWALVPSPGEQGLHRGCSEQRRQLCGRPGSGACGIALGRLARTAHGIRAGDP
jgi:hypothetical protein